MIRAHLNGTWFTAIPAEQRCDYYGDKEIDQGEECAGCMWRGQRFAVCKAATEAAVAAGLPDCESRPDRYQPGFVYVPDPSAGRQLDLLEAP